MFLHLIPRFLGLSQDIRTNAQPMKHLLSLFPACLIAVCVNQTSTDLVPQIQHPVGNIVV